MNSRPIRCALVGIDDGSRLALQPLAAFASFAAVDADPASSTDEKYWTEIFRAGKFTGMVIGTSDSPRARRIEKAARLAATAMDLKIVAIEDYAGNYFDVPGARTDLLMVESTFSETLYKQRLAGACPRVLVTGAPRYDPYRANATALRAATRAQWANEPRGAPTILWAGQPESADCIETLRRIAPAIRATQARVLFKAHPRDGAHKGRAYARLLDELGIEHIDVTSQSVAATLHHAPRLVLTQFSAVAIEAGFYGVPALHLLYQDIGGARLRQKKGFDIPPHCLYGAALFVHTVGTEGDMMERALFDEAARSAVIDCFDDFFDTGKLLTPALADYLIALMGLG